MALPKPTIQVVQVEKHLSLELVPPPLLPLALIAPFAMTPEKLKLVEVLLAPAVPLATTSQELKLVEVLLAPVVPLATTPQEVKVLEVLLAPVVTLPLVLEVPPRLQTLRLRLVLQHSRLRPLRLVRALLTELLGLAPAAPEQPERLEQALVLLVRHLQHLLFPGHLPPAVPPACSWCHEWTGHARPTAA